MMIAFIIIAGGAAFALMAYVQPVDVTNRSN